MRMPKNKDEFERAILLAFDAGMQAGYGVEHTQKSTDELVAMCEFAEQNGFKRKDLIS